MESPLLGITIRLTAFYMRYETSAGLSITLEKKQNWDMNDIIEEWIGLDAAVIASGHARIQPK